MEQNKTGKYFKYAIGEIILVVIGILIALQINNWNEARKDRQKETAILKSLQRDFRVDIKNIQTDVDYKKGMLNDYVNCLAILAGDKEATKEDFNQYFKTIIQVGGVNLNATTYNNLQNNGEIKLLKNKSLTDSIVEYYNTNFIGWQSSLRDYTRNHIGPYILNFDYIPEVEFVNLDSDLQDFIDVLPENNEFNKPEKSLEEYKNNYFIVNMLKFKSRNIVGVLNEYNTILNYAKNLDKSIQSHIEAHD